MSWNFKLAIFFFFFFLLKCKYHINDVKILHGARSKIWTTPAKRKKKQSGSITKNPRGNSFIYLSHNDMSNLKYLRFFLAWMVFLTSLSMPWNTVKAGTETWLWIMLLRCFQIWNITAWVASFLIKVIFLGAIDRIQERSKHVDRSMTSG